MGKYDFLSADYDMSYYDLVNLIDQFFPNGELNNEQKKILLSSLVENYDPLDTQVTAKIFSVQSFWEEQTGSAVQAITLKKNYIILHGRVLFLLSILGSAMNLIIQLYTKQTLPDYLVAIFNSIEITTKCILELNAFFKSIVKLKDNEYCLYCQAILHSNKYDPFTLEEAISWFPECGKVCNLNKQDCDYLCKASGKCMIKCSGKENTNLEMNANNIKDAIKSLLENKLLIPDGVGKDETDNNEIEKYKFHFVR